MNDLVCLNRRESCNTRVFEGELRNRRQLGVRTAIQKCGVYNMLTAAIRIY